MTATMHDHEGRPALRFERRLRHPLATVWRAITEPTELEAWFPFLVEVDLRAGGRMTFTHATGAVAPSTGTIVALDPPRLLAYTWGDAELRFELSEDGDGTVLVFTHVFDDRAGAASFAAGWDLCLDALGATVDGRGHEQVTGSWELLNARYTREFGLLDGEITDLPDGRRMRFEQVLVRPVDDVWPRLAGATPAVGDPISATALPDGAPAEIIEVDAPKLVAAAGPDGTVVRWELSPRDFGCRLVVTLELPAEAAGIAEATDRVADVRAGWRDRLARFADELYAG